MCKTLRPFLVSILKITLLACGEAIIAILERRKMKHKKGTMSKVTGMFTPGCLMYQGPSPVTTWTGVVRTKESRNNE